MLSINRTLIKMPFEQELCEVAFDNLRSKPPIQRKVG